MMHKFRNKALLFALASAACWSFTPSSCHADDLLNRAAGAFSQKNYSSSHSLAGQSAESPHRTFLLGVSALRAGHPDEALTKLVEAEQKLPLVADYAAYYRAEALFRLNRYSEAAVLANAMAKNYPNSLLVRRAEKLAVDALALAGDFKGGLKAARDFVEKYAAGNDSVDVLFKAGNCREELGDKEGAALIYRGIWLNNPAAPQAAMSRERLDALQKSGITVQPGTPEELLRRASTLYSLNEFTMALQTLSSIPLTGQPAGFASRVTLRTGMAQYRLRNYKAAEAAFATAAASTVAAVSSEARYWLARSLERQAKSDKAFDLYMQLAGEGNRQEFAPVALQEAAGLRRNQGNYAEAARLYDQLIRTFPNSKQAGQSTWDAAWCRYLSGDYGGAAEVFKQLVRDEGLREKALYWLARSLENTGSSEAGDYFRTLLAEYPSGFYAVWYREQKGLKDEREPLLQPSAANVALLPAVFEKPRLLASLGMQEDARREMSAARKKAGNRKTPLLALARLYQEMGDYGAAMGVFQQEKLKWEQSSLPLWSVGYPMAFGDLVSEQTSANGLSQALIYSLIRAESGFAPAIKSPAGAVGLMQLMPATAKAIVHEKGNFDPLRLAVPSFNIKLGTRHFRDLLKSHDGDVVYSIAAYNAGSGAVKRWRNNLKGLKKDEFIESIPYRETRDYVKKVYGAAATYRQLYGIK